jgi:hypothetical protein
MSVITFPAHFRPNGGAWRTAELNVLVAGLASTRVDGREAGGWATGETEAGDPQFYLLGPLPEEECVVCISRLGRTYVLEDGAGRVLFEHNSLRLLAERAKSVLQRKKAQIFGRLALMWFAVRETFEQRFDAVLGEGDELLVHLVPQLAALA